MRAFPCPFDDEYALAEDPAISTIGGTAGNTTAFQDKLQLDYVARAGGQYMVVLSYGWNHDATGNDFEGRLIQDGLQLSELHKQEPKDSVGTLGSTGTSQGHYVARKYRVDLTVGQATTFIYQFRTDAGAAESSTWDAKIEVERLDL